MIITIPIRYKIIIPHVRAYSNVAAFNHYDRARIIKKQPFKTAVSFFIFILFFMPASILFTLTSGGISGFSPARRALASPLTENTRTLEVKLKYKTINEINVSSAFGEQDSRQRDASLFSIHRNNHIINDFLIHSSAAVIAGDFGVRLLYGPDTGSYGEWPDQNDANHKTKTEMIKYLNSFKALSDNSFFGAEANAVEFDGEHFYFGTKGGDIIEAGPISVRHISIISAAGRYRINKLKYRRKILLILTEGGGVYTFYKNRFFKISSRSHRLTSDDINDIEIFDIHGITYAAIAASNGATILRVNGFHDNDFEYVYSYKTPSPIETIAFANGVLYTGGAFGIDRIEPDRSTFIKSSVLKDVYITSIVRNLNNSDALTASSYSSGIYRFSRSIAPIKIIPQSRLQPAGIESGIKKIIPAAESIFILSNKNLYEYKNGRLLAAAESSNGFSDKITAVCEYQNYLFCATFNGGVFIYDEGRINGFEAFYNQKLSGARVNALEAFNNYLLIGSTNGLDILDGARRTLINLKKPLSNDRINAIHVKNGRAFIGTSSGISVLHDDLSVENIDLNPETIDKRVYCLYYDEPSSTIYFGTYRGFGEMHYPSRRLKTYFTINSAIADNWITSIADYGPDRLLVATYDRAISIFDKHEKKFGPFGTRNTLPSKMINANALFDYKNYIFAGTYNGGLALINKTLANKGKSGSLHFNTRNGLCSNMVTSFASYKDRIAIATFGGLAFIKIKDIIRAFE